MLFQIIQTNFVYRKNTSKTIDPVIRFLQKKIQPSTSNLPRRFICLKLLVSQLRNLWLASVPGEQQDAPSIDDLVLEDNLRFGRECVDANFASTLCRTLGEVTCLLTYAANKNQRISMILLSILKKRETINLFCFYFPPFLGIYIVLLDQHND
jgi:hypothetical protein